jgi:hypothetical protein
MHRRSRAGRSAATRVLLLSIVALMAVAAVAAAPAAAAPTPTTLTVTAQSTSVNWGAKAVLNGVLQTTEAPARPVDGQQVLVQYATSPTAILWTTAATVTNNAAPYTSGAYTYSWTASRNYYWRMRFAGTSEWGSADGAFVYIKVKPVIGKPSCPASVKHGKKFTVSGSLKPKYPSGSKNVTVKAERYSGGKWKAYKSYKATTANSGSYSKYSVKISISKKGKYHFYATTADTSTLSAGKSGYSRSMKVK